MVISGAWCGDLSAPSRRDTRTELIPGTAPSTGDRPREDRLTRRLGLPPRRPPSRRSYTVVIPSHEASMHGGVDDRCPGQAELGTGPFPSPAKPQ
jgi:hypothetical protein